MIWPEKASKTYSHISIVRANKSEVNDYMSRDGDKKIVNGRTSEYNRIDEL